MNRRDFDTLVRFIKRLPRSNLSREDVVVGLANELDKDNSNFNVGRFLESCGYKRSIPKPAKEV